MVMYAVNKALTIAYFPELINCPCVTNVNIKPISDGEISVVDLISVVFSEIRESVVNFM